VGTYAYCCDQNTQRTRRIPLTQLCTRGVQVAPTVGQQLLRPTIEEGLSPGPFRESQTQTGTSNTTYYTRSRVTQGTVQEPTEEEKPKTCKPGLSQNIIVAFNWCSSNARETRAARVHEVQGVPGQVAGAAVQCQTNSHRKENTAPGCDMVQGVLHSAAGVLQT